MMAASSQASNPSRMVIICFHSLVSWLTLREACICRTAVPV